MKSIFSAQLDRENGAAAIWKKAKGNESAMRHLIQYRECSWSRITTQILSLKTLLSDQRMLFRIFNKSSE